MTKEKKKYRSEYEGRTTINGSKGKKEKEKIE
jgi:hypothetical protein